MRQNGKGGSTVGSQGKIVIPATETPVAQVHDSCHERMCLIKGNKEQKMKIIEKLTLDSILYRDRSLR